MDRETGIRLEKSPQERLAELVENQGVLLAVVEAMGEKGA